MKSISIFFIWLMVCVSGVYAADSEVWQNSALNKALERGELRVGIEPGYMPFEIKNRAGSMIGFDVDMAEAMADAMGVKLKLVNTSWDLMIPSLLMDKIDIIISGMTITQERNLQINFSDPYIVIGQTLLVSNNLKGKVSNYSDLNSSEYRLSSKRGTTGDFAAKRHLGKAKLMLFDSEAEAVMAVLDGKVDAFIYDLPFNAYYASKKNEQIFHLDQPFTYEPVGWGVKKGDPDMLNWLNHFLNQIKGDGTYDRMYQKWFESSDWYDTVR